MPLDSIVSPERGTLTIRVQDGATCEGVGSGRLITYRLEQVERYTGAGLSPAECR